MGAVNCEKGVPAMSQVLLITAWVLPLAITPFLFIKRMRWLTTLATLPAIAATWIVESKQVVHIPWLLLGTHLGIDEISRWLLLASALVWLVASVYAHLQQLSRQFTLFFTLAMAGNFLLLLAMDIITFYLGFALMGLATAALIKEQTTDSSGAMRLYLSWTIAGELLLFCALLLLAAHSPGLRFDVLSLANVSDGVLLLIIIGFGIKIALPGLHFWMPATYARLPIAAAAVVSGPMISAGIVGLIRFLVPGSGAHQLIGQILLVAGLVSVCYAGIIGLVQTQARIALAYSSMSKMGLLAAALGLALIYPAQATIMIAAIVMYTLHHLLIKSALFFGLGIAEQSNHRISLVAGLMLLAISLAGFPFTSGALTKAQLSAALPGDLNYFVIALFIAAFISLLLIARVLYLIASSKASATTAPRSVTGMWWLLIMVIVVWPWLFKPTPGKWGDIAVLITASGIAVGVWLLKPSWLVRTVGLVPAGDLLHILSRTFKRLVHWLRQWLSSLAPEQRLLSFKEYAVRGMNRLKKGLSYLTQPTMTWYSAGIIWLIVGLIMFITMYIDV
jgi:formate hydrogenlyase subunit 3/multisubunit Na+/H+ antiporter MnhD subunit